MNPPIHVFVAHMAMPAAAAHPPGSPPAMAGGSALDRSAVWRGVSAAYRGGGMRGATPHSLRHIHVRRLLASGAAVGTHSVGSGTRHWR